MLEKVKLQADLCVVGGGMAGICAAISAARSGIKVVLMHERPVLGGNASSEIRMWICGAKGENNRETGILEEIALENMYRNPTKSYAIWDTVLYDFVHREKNITLLLNCACMDARVDEGNFAYGRSRRICSVTGYQMTTQRFYEVESKFYCDSSGDSILAPLTGAEFRLGREGREEFSEDTFTDVADDMTMGMSCLIQGRETTRKVDFIAPEFSTKLNDESFEHRMPDLYEDTENFWYLELGGNRDTIGDTEFIRDELLGLAVGTWDYLKNSGKFRAENWDLDFLGFLPGKRESRRMVGEYMITQRDISDNVCFEDEIAFGGWPLDDHFPGGFYHRGTPNSDVQTPEHYSIPYRALYSKNVDNLFFAGRNISMTHMAMSSIRVMATCALLGEAVGRAAAIATKESMPPHGVYLDRIGTLQQMLMDGDCFLPRMRRGVGDVCRGAALTGGWECLRDGQDREHRIYSNIGCKFSAVQGTEITYKFDKSKVSSVHIVFDSDLNRLTQDGSHCERHHNTRANQRIDSPRLKMPATLCRAFRLIGCVDGRAETILEVDNNRRRSYHLTIDRELDTLILIPEALWGGGNEIGVVSFDFK